MTHSPTGRGRARAAAVSTTLVALALGGCTFDSSTDSTESSPASSPAAVNPPSEQLSGEIITGSGPIPYPGTTFPLHDGARSVVIEFACEGGHQFWVELGDSMAQGQSPLNGTCDGLSELAWPVTGQASTTLSIVIPEGVEWSASPLFSTEEFFIDPDLEAECERASVSLSALSNAEFGFTVYEAFDEAEWASRLDGAATGFAALAAESSTSLAIPFEQLAATASSPDRVPGELLTRTQDATMQITTTCAANYTSIFMLAEFGG